MYRLEKTVVRDERYRHERDNPSFSSTLLDKIYRSIDDGETKHGDLKFYRETMQKKQSKGNMKCNRSRRDGEEEEEEKEMSRFQRACLIEKWMEKKVTEKANADRKQVFSEFQRKSHHDYDRNHDNLFFSSTSSSSDSSSGGFSSSDTESMYVTKTKSSCFVTSRPISVRTSVSARSEKPIKTEKTGRTLFYEQRESHMHMLDDYHYNSASNHTPRLDENLFKSKSRAMKIYGNLKKVKQPISPGGRLASFINSLFTTGNTKKARGSSSSVVSCDNDERKLKSGQVSTCTSASSFSRSCLSKNSPSTRERLRNGVKRTVRFCPVSVIVDEDCRPCGQKCLYEEEEDSSLLSVSVPTAWKIGKSPSRKCEEDVKFQIIEKTRRVEEMATTFLKEYHLNQRKKDFTSRDTRSNYVMDDMDEDVEDDDAASYSSSDLFELDHLVLIGNNRFQEELPVYETTHIETNRAIANGLI